MDVMWAPWRMEYILGEKEKGCIFCDRAGEGREEDRKNLILYRGNECFVILNKYPYNNGHLMITPYRHVPDISFLNEDELLELMLLSQKLLKTMKKGMKPDGFNMGINQGKVAGAGIESHVHLHIVPRWDGDTNFMPVVSSARVIPQHLTETYDILKEILDSI